MFAPAGFVADYDLNGLDALPGIHHYKSFGGDG